MTSQRGSTAGQCKKSWILQSTNGLNMLVKWMLYNMGPSNYVGCIIVTKAGVLDWWWYACLARNDRYVSPVSCPRVSQCVENKMDKHNLARVFGPTLVGHAVPDPDPMTILHDTNRQPRVQRAKPVCLIMALMRRLWVLHGYSSAFTTAVLLLTTGIRFYFLSGCWALAQYLSQILGPVCICRYCKFGCCPSPRHSRSER